MPVAGIWVRHTRASMGGADVTDASARWQTAATPALYLADREQTAWAEFYRAAAEAGVSPADPMPRLLYRLEVKLENVADLRTEKARRALGLPRLRPTRTQWPAFQEAGERLHRAGAQGILYASAARVRSLSLCVFEAGLNGLSLVGTPLTVIAAPAPPRGMRT